MNTMSLNHDADEIVLYKKFGQFVQELRQMRRDESDEKWTRKYLCQQIKKHTNIDISENEIRRVESGQAKNIKRYLAPLSAAFELNETEKEHFWAAAGFIYRNEVTPNRNEIIELFKTIEFPAFARTPIWDFIAFNGFNSLLWGYTPEKIALLRSGLGPNLLRVLFEPEFDSITYKGNESVWRKDIRRSIKAFCFESFRYVNTSRFKAIKTAMMRSADFRIYWETSDPSHVETTRPIAHVEHPQYGLLEFLSLRTPVRYLGSNVDVSIYVPLASSLNNYEQLKEDAKRLPRDQQLVEFDPIALYEMAVDTSTSVYGD